MMVLWLGDVLNEIFAGDNDAVTRATWGKSGSLYQYIEALLTTPR